MIIEHKDKVEEIMPYLSLRLAKALAYLRDTDFSKLEDGKYEVDGKEIFAVISSYKTEKKKKFKPETHFKYIDIQYILSGEEVICYAPNNVTDKMIDEQDYKEDITFYKDEIKGEKKYHLDAGQLMILFPWEIHRPKCQAGEKACKVRKVIIKVLSEG